MIKAVIFDMDGVLLDSEPYYFANNMAIFAEMGFADKITLEDYRPFVGSPAWRMWETLLKRFGDKVINRPIDDLVHYERERYLKLLQDKCLAGTVEPIPGVIALLEDLTKSGYKLAIASSSDINVIHLVVETLGIRKYFDFLVTGDYVKKGKPAPDIFLYAAKELGVEPKNCAVIEDSCNGVKGAAAAGMYVVGYYNPNSGEQDLSLADVIIDNIADWRPNMKLGNETEIS